MVRKSQSTNPNVQGNPKAQLNPKETPRAKFIEPRPRYFGIWSFLGHWVLELGISPSQTRLNSRNHFFNHIPAHIRQPIVAALEAERQTFVVQAEQVHDRRLQVVDVDLFFGDVVTDLVRLTD